MFVFRHLISLGLATCLLLGAALPLSAQSADEYDAPEDFAGFSWLANRFFVQDPAELRATVTADDATPAAFPPIMAIVMVMAFETEGHAEDAFIPYSELMARSASVETDDPVTGKPVEDLGDEALAFTVTDTTDGYAVDITTLTVREGEIIYLTLTMTANDSSADLSRAYMDPMLEREMSDEDVRFNETGGSTGGPFALFPEEGDELLGGMMIQSDQYLTAGD